MANKFQVDTAGTLLTSLMGYWKMEEASGTRADASVNGKDLADNGGVTQVTGKVNQGSFYTSSTPTYLSAAADTDLDITTGDFSLAFWVKSTSVANSTRLFGKRVLATGQGFYVIVGTTTKFLQCDVADSGGTHFTGSQGTTNVIDSNWHLCIITWSNSGQRVRIYVDNGADESTIDASSGTVNSISTAGTGNVFQIGRSDVFVPYDGAMDEVGFWGKVLSSQERTDLWNGGAGQTMVSSGGTVIQSNLLSMQVG